MVGMTIQPIIILRDKAHPGTHLDTIAAAAAAAVAAYELDLTSGTDMAGWDAWMEDFYGKSVRRADPGAFTRLTAGHPGVIRVGEAAAAAYSPVDPDQMPPAMARLQVSGTEMPRSFWTMPAGPAPTVILNGSLSMSTGKAAAQAAHALMAWYLAVAAGRRQAWSDSGRGVRIVEASGGRFNEMMEAAMPETIIEDQGRTEIAPGSVTAYVRGF